MSGLVLRGGLPVLTTRVYFVSGQTIYRNVDSPVLTVTTIGVFLVGACQRRFRIGLVLGLLLANPALDSVCCQLCQP